MIEMEDEIEFEKDTMIAYAQYITCPFCKHENIDSWEVKALQNDGESCDILCDKCGNKFRATINIETTYTTDIIEDEAH